MNAAPSAASAVHRPSLSFSPKKSTAACSTSGSSSTEWMEWPGAISSASTRAMLPPPRPMSVWYQSQMWM